MTIRKVRVARIENKSNKKTNLSGSPKQDKSKSDKKDNNVGKENNCMNKGKTDDVQKDTRKSNKQSAQASPVAKRKKEEPQSFTDSTQPDPEAKGEECKEIEDLKEFLKNCCRSKRKVLIKPNIPIKWITDLKAKLAKIQAK